MAFLVTGAFGCIGAWVVKRLLAVGERPVAYDLGDDPWRLRMIVAPGRLQDVVRVRGDIADREAISDVVDRVASMASGPSASTVRDAISASPQIRRLR